MVVNQVVSISLKGLMLSFAQDHNQISNAFVRGIIAPTYESQLSSVTHTRQNMDFFVDAVVAHLSQVTNQKRTSLWDLKSSVLDLLCSSIVEFL